MLLADRRFEFFFCVWLLAIKIEAITDHWTQDTAVTAVATYDESPVAFYVGLLCFDPSIVDLSGY